MQHFSRQFPPFEKKLLWPIDSLKSKSIYSSFGKCAVMTSAKTAAEATGSEGGGDGGIEVSTTRMVKVSSTSEEGSTCIETSLLSNLYEHI